MNLWIRSQDKTKIMQVFSVVILKGDNNYLIEEYAAREPLGKYKKKKRAIEVLDEIQKIITDTSKIVVETYASGIKDNDIDKIKEIASENLEDVTVANGCRIKALNIETVVYEMPQDEVAK